MSYCKKILHCKTELYNIFVSLKNKCIALQNKAKQNYLKFEKQVLIIMFNAIQYQFPRSQNGLGTYQQIHQSNELFAYMNQ